MFLEGNILLIADLGLWNGRKSGYRIIDNNVGNILSSLSEGEIEYFADTQTKQVKAVQHHHDGTNYITFREIKPGVNIDNLTEKDLQRYIHTKGYFSIHPELVPSCCQGLWMVTHSSRFLAAAV